MTKVDLNSAVAGPVKSLQTLDLRKHWVAFKKALPAKSGLSPEGKAAVTTLVKGFDKGLGPLLDKHGEEIAKLPASAAKVEKLSGKIAKVLADYRKAAKEALAGKDEKLVDDEFKEIESTIAAAAAKQATWLEDIQQARNLLARQTAAPDPAMGTEAQALALIKALSEAGKAMADKMAAMRKQIDSLDKSQSDSEQWGQVGAAKGHVLSKAEATARTAAFAAKATLLFRSKLRQPAQVVQAHLKSAKSFHAKEANTWSKSRGAKLGSFYDLEAAITAAEELLKSWGDDDAALFKFIATSNRIATISAIFAKSK